MLWSKGEGEKNIESVSSPLSAAAAASGNLQLYNNGEFVACPLMERRVRFVFLEPCRHEGKVQGHFHEKVGLGIERR